MTRRSLVICLVLALAGTVYAAVSENVKLTGYVVDNACAARSAGDNVVEKVKAHTVKCAAMPNCAKSGYSIVTADGKVYKLDDTGNAKVAEILKNTKVEKGLSVNVEGMVEGDTIKVASISEAAATS
ncbi:MAG TPA: hypothetical protein VNO14_06410 [Blastocatellia bacterium]|nr:hypothetical protein [Blastocatellia bacterium]